MKKCKYCQIEFICYDKDGNNLGTAIDNTNNLWEIKHGSLKQWDYLQIQKLTIVIFMKLQVGNNKNTAFLQYF